ncbi:hypothetical protein [Prauserella muralis]|uniref:Uncharacterized protein n=1 Tax=Prauserella muralis TaxID=588067 RepID=A0A2V4B997_9PSEU|nr:hypothetical protein [Prauserella muralis]PXY31934.1 hypothetical protein BAY60_06305 [Prauserella muralis]TWE13641.1 hypothetical protein FHX69_5765 [Prauserella muralis]
MNRRGLPPLARWAFLCALALAVVAMHHVDTAPSGPPATGQHHVVAPAHAPGEGDHPAPGPGSHDSGLLHLCLAVLAALGAIVLACRVLRRHRAHPPRARRAVSAFGAARAPPLRSGRDLLHFACVIRV